MCPTGGAHIGADDIVSVDQGRCIGCLYCMAACPYQVRSRSSATGAEPIAGDLTKSKVYYVR